MTRSLNVHFLPELVAAEQLAGRTVVVVDVLRATTTITYALASGAEAVIPCLEVDEAKRVAAGQGRGVVLGGERNGLAIEGFDLGNSPTEYTSESVGKRVVVFTTTNGTRAMRHCALAQRVLLGAFVNLSAVCDQLATESRIEILCAGTHGEITREDVLFAGAVVQACQATGEMRTCNDQSLLAQEAWSRLTSELATGDRPLHESLRRTRGARNLIEIGLERDIEIAAQIDKFDLVPELDRRTGKITAS